MNDQASPYAPPREVASVDDCFFYHSVDVPGHGLIRGQWDLRGKVGEYLGHVDLKGKRVLELGTASGYLCFEMEKAGAEVIGYDLSEQQEWDLVPFGGAVAAERTAEHKAHIRKLNNAWWFLHRALSSRARVVYGSVYEVPAAIGPVHVSTFGSILLHLRDPFLALQRAAALTTETMIVTDQPPPWHRLRRLLSPWSALARIDQRFATYLVPELNFLPDPDRKDWVESWWAISPELVGRFLKILGFPRISVSYHKHVYHHGEGLRLTKVRSLFTVVGARK